MVKKIYGNGSPLLDIASEVDAAMLTKYDLKPANAVLAEEKHMPMYDELAARSDVQYIPGGATLNSIRVANWMLRPVAKGQCSFTGCIGDDKFGKIMSDKCAAEGLVTPFQTTSEKQTGTCGVLVTGKERSLVAALSAAEKFTTDHLESAEVKALVEGAEIYYVAGFFLTVALEGILKVAKHACENKKTFCFNLSAPFIIQFFGEQLKQVLPYVDILFANETEALQYGETDGSAGKTVSEVAQFLQKFTKADASRPRTVVFTQGAESTVVATADGTTEYAVPKLEADLLVDTNGAGDAFVGGFLSFLAQEAPMQKCVEAGHYAARTIIQHPSCTFPAEPAFE